MTRLSSALFILSALGLFAASCSSNEIGNAKDVNPENIYFDYRVWGDEDAGFITTRLQYRFGGRSGTTLLLEEPSKAEFDGKILNADSSKMNGAYYEISQPIKDFAGQHSIVFTDIKGKQYKEEFSFQPMTLRTTVPGTVNRGDLLFELDGLAPQEYIRIILSDTAAFSEGINRIDSVKNGRFVITKSQLRRLTNGPIHLEFTKEDEKRVKNGTREGGRISISYGLRREFELKD